MKRQAAGRNSEGAPAGQSLGYGAWNDSPLRLALLARMRTVAAVDSMSKINAQMQLSKLQVEVKNTKLTLKSVQRNYESLSSSYQKKERECQKLQALLASEKETVQSLLDQLEESDARKENQDQNAKADNEALAKLEQKTKELENAKSQVRALQSEKAKFNSETRSLRKKMLESESKYHIVAKYLKESVEDNKLLQANIDNVLVEAEDWHRNHKESSARADELQSEKERLEGSLEGSLKDIRAKVAEKEKEVADKTKEILKLNHELHDKDEEKRVTEAQYKSCKRQLDSMETELQSREDSIREMRESLRAVTEDKDRNQKALEYEKGLAVESKFKMNQLIQQLNGEKTAMSELLAKKSRGDTDLDVLSKQVAGLQQIIDENSKREEQNLQSHALRLEEKEREIRLGLEAQKKLREELEQARRDHAQQTSAHLARISSLLSTLDGLQNRIEARLGDKENFKGALSFEEIVQASEACLLRECELTELAESLDKHFGKVQEWSESARLAVENAQISGQETLSEAEGKRAEVIQRLEAMVRTLQGERDLAEAAAKSKIDALTSEIEALKQSIDSSLSQHNQAVGEMSEMMEAERFASKERIAALRGAMDDLEKQFDAEKVANTALLEREVDKYKTLHEDEAKRARKLKSELEDSNYKFLDLSNENTRASKQIENISEDLSKYSEHLVELNLVAEEEAEYLGLSVGESDPAGSPMNLTAQVFALRTKFLKMTQVNQDVASKCKALIMAQG